MQSNKKHRGPHVYPTVSAHFSHISPMKDTPLIHTDNDFNIDKGSIHRLKITNITPIFGYFL